MRFFDSRLRNGISYEKYLTTRMAPVQFAMNVCHRRHTLSSRTKYFQDDPCSLVSPHIGLLAHLELERHDSFLQWDHQEEQRESRECGRAQLWNVNLGGVRYVT